MSESLVFEPTSWRVISRDYSHIIEEIQTPRESSNSLVMRNILFRDMSKLKCKEFIDQETGYISVFQYDYYDSTGNIIMKFHSEPHNDPKYQTRTEPFHLHVKKDAADLAALVRKSLPVSLRTVDGILTFIEHSAHLQYVFINTTK